MLKMLLLIAVIAVVALLANHFRWGYDDTDDYRPAETFGERSGLTLYTDYRTGVQYVKAGLFGATTPRLDRDGKPLLKENHQRR